MASTESINKDIESLNYKGDISDGSHTFSELYYQRAVLFATIVNSYKDRAWKSLLHEDGTMYEGYFIVGIDTDEGQYSYHYQLSMWDLFECLEVYKAPKWDGHTPEHVRRLLTLGENYDN